MTDYLFSSNTLGASANQFYFEADADTIQIGRVFYRITQGGKYNYSLLFSNIIDSTYADGSKSRKNRVMSSWTIHTARFARFPSDSFENGLENAPTNSDFFAINFNGRICKQVEAGEVFASDSFEFFAEKGDYICIELAFSGSELPYHEESLLPIYKHCGGKWYYDKRMPLPACIGCDREVKARIGFFGDSITQGIGTQANSYLHWNARLAEMLGSDYSYWNLGIGFARADDAASEGIWLEKAMLCDIVFVCMGVNDLLQGFSADEIKNSLLKIISVFKNAGKKVILQTLPPFDYCGETITAWEEINRFILTELKDKVELVFDCVKILGEENSLHNAKYGGHPNEQGCELWTDELYKSIKKAGVLQ